MKKALLKKQLLELGQTLLTSGKTGRRRVGAAAVGYGVLVALVALVLLFSFGTMALALGQLLVPLGLGWLYFAFLELTALLVGTAAGVFVSHAALFEAKDNELLLSLPIPPGEILAVRVFGVFVSNWAYLMLVWLPTEVVYAALAAHPLRALLAAVPLSFLLAAAATVGSVLVGWAVAAANVRTAHRTLATVALTLAFFALYAAGMQQVQAGMEWLVAHAEALEQQPGRFASLRLLGRAGQGNVTALLVLAVCVAVPAAGLYRALSRRYLALMTTRRAAAKPVRRAVPGRPVPLRTALLRRELRHLGSSAPYLLNCALPALFLPLAGIAALVKAEALRTQLAGLPPALTAPLLCGVVCLLQSTCLVSAPSVSLEGRSFCLLCSLPVTPWQALRAKLDVHVLLTLPGAVLCAGCVLAAARVPWGELLAALVLVGLDCILTAELGLSFGVRFANLRWTREVSVIKQGAATGFALVCGWAAALVLCAGCTVLAWCFGARVALWGCAAVVAALDAALWHRLRHAGAARFAALEVP